MKALSIRNPWAWLIFNGKPVENRDWYTGFRGRFLVHASKGCTRDEYEAAVDFAHRADPSVVVPPLVDLPRGAVVGAATLTDCVERHDSRYFVGRYGFVLADQVELAQPIPCKGALGFFNVPPEVEAEIWRRFKRDTMGPKGSCSLFRMRRADSCV